MQAVSKEHVGNRELRQREIRQMERDGRKEAKEVVNGEEKIKSERELE